MHVRAALLSPTPLSSRLHRARPLPLWLSGFSSDTCAASVTGRRRPSTLESADNPLRCLSRLCSGAASDAEGGDGNELGLEFEMAKSGGGECGD